MKPASLTAMQKGKPGSLATSTRKGKKHRAAARHDRTKTDVGVRMRISVAVADDLKAQLKTQRQRLLSLEKKVADLRTGHLRRTAAELRAVNAGQGPAGLLRLQADLECMREQGITGETGDVIYSQTEEDAV